MAWSGFWDDAGDTTAHSLLVNKSSNLTKVAKTLKKRGTRDIAGILDGVSTGVTGVARTYPQLTAVTGGYTGGTQTIGTVTQQTAVAATAAQVTIIDAIANDDAQPTSYPADAGGNGGARGTVDFEPGLG